MDPSKIFCGVDMFGKPMGSNAATSPSSGNVFTDFYRDFMMDEKTKKIEKYKQQKEAEEAEKRRKSELEKGSEEERLKKIKEHLSEADRLRMEEEERNKKASIFALPRGSGSRQGSTNSPGTLNQPGSPTLVPGSPPKGPIAAAPEKQSSFSFFGFRSTSAPRAKKEDTTATEAPSSPGTKDKKRSQSVKRESSKKKDEIAAALVEESRPAPLEKRNSKRFESPAKKPVEDEDENRPVLTKQNSVRKQESLPGW